MAPVMAELIRHQAICLQHPLQDFLFLGFSKSISPKTNKYSEKNP